MSHKLRADQIRTINKDKYRFSCNGKEWKTIDEMLQVWLELLCIPENTLHLLFRLELTMP